MPTTEPASANVRAEMVRRGHTQADLAALLKLSQNSVSRRLLGQTSWRVDELRTIASAFGIPLSALLDNQTAGAA